MTARTPDKSVAKNVARIVTRIVTVGFPWFRREDYAAARAIMQDRDRLSPSYEAWLHRMTEAEADATADGYHVIRVMIDPQTFPLWYRRHHLQIDVTARTLFAAQAGGGLRTIN
jgi:hypothetical protein